MEIAIENFYMGVWAPGLKFAGLILQLENMWGGGGGGGGGG